MPHSMISSTGSNHGTVTDTTVSTLDSFDPERDGATVSSQLNYSQKLPDLNVTANKYNRWNQRPSAEYVVNTSAIGRVFPKYADSDDNSNSSSSFSLNLGRAPLRQPLQQQQKQSPPKARSPLTTLTNIPHEFGRPKSPILSNADAFSRAGSFSKRPMAKMQPRVADENDSTTNTNTFTLSNKPGTYPKRSIAEMQPEVADANDSTTNTNTFTRSNKPATYPKRSIAEMQPEVADANDSTTNTNTYTRNSRFTHQQYASPNVSSKRQQQPSATNTPQHPFQQHATASTTSKPAQPSFHQETTPSAALKTAQPHLYRQTSTTHDPTQPSYHQNPTASTTHNPTHASFVLPAATSNSDSTTLDNGVPVITQGGHAHTRRGSRELVQAVSFGPVHSIIIPDDEEKIYLAIELLKSRVLRGEAENAELKAMYDQLKSAFNELRASHDQLAVSDNEHKQSLDSLKRSHTRSEDYSRSLEHENGILKEQNAGLEEQNQGLELAITDLQEKLEHASAFNSFHNQRSVSNKISAAASGPVHGNASSSRDIQAQHDHVNYRAPSVAASTLTREILSPSKDVQGEHEYRNHRATSAAASAPTHGVSPSKDVEGEHEYRNHRAPSVAASASTHGILSPSKDGQNEIQYQKQSAASVAASVPLHEKGSTSRSVQIQHQHQEPLAPSVRTRENVSSRDTQSQYQHRKQSAHSVTQEQHQKHPVLSASARHVLDSLCSEHNAKDCMLCTRVTSFGDKTTGGAPIRSANPVPVSKRMPVATPYEEEPTIRPSVEPALALTTVIKGLEDEIAHLKMRQSEVQAQYQNLDASLGKRERRRIGKELESLLQQLEFKGDQLYGLYDVLEGMQ